MNLLNLLDISLNLQHFYGMDIFINTGFRNLTLCVFFQMNRFKLSFNVYSRFGVECRDLTCVMAADVKEGTAYLFL